MADQALSDAAGRTTRVLYHVGCSAITAAQAKAKIDNAFAILTHCSGDAAVETLLDRCTHFYWGDYHLGNVFGPERAENISPTGWGVQRGMMFSTHHDAPVAKPDSMRVLSATVTRMTGTGKILGPQHK